MDAALVEDVHGTLRFLTSAAIVTSSVDSSAERLDSIVDSA